jgi:Protein of unknown function (DUF1800)
MGRVCSGLPAPSALPLSVEVREGVSTTITLGGSDIIGRPLSYRVVSYPTSGDLSGEPPQVVYKPRSNATFDTLNYVVSNGVKESIPAVVAITILRVPASSPTALPTSQPTASPSPTLSPSPSPTPEIGLLSPYKNTISEDEVRHVCKKVAFGCSPQLIEIGVKQGLSALIDALFSYSPAATVEDVARTYLLNQNQRNTSDGAARYWLYHMIKGNSLKERMALFLHEHFAIDLSGYNDSPEQHDWIDIHLRNLRADPLGSFEDVLMAMHSDPAMLDWLDNRYNLYNLQRKRIEPNENYAREVLELFTMGTRDFFSGAANYTETDMQELTRSMTGFFIHKPNGKEVAGFTRDRWDPGEKTLFEGTASEKVAAFDYESATQHLLYGARATARGIAGKLIRVFVTPDPPEAAVDEIANLLTKNRYNMGIALRKLIGSNLMFSSTSKKLCMSSPVEHIVSFMRVLDFPLTNVNTMGRIYDFIRDGGQHLLKAPSVFGWKGCGVGTRGQDRAYGNVWNSVQLLLFRQRQLVNVLNALYSSEGNNVLDKLFLNASSADAVVASLSRMLHVQLLPQEQKFIVDRLMNRKKNSNGTYQTDLFSPTNQAVSRTKVAGLLELLTLHPRAAIQ